MSQPPPYVPATRFISYQAQQSWFPGQQLDAEFNNLDTIIGDIEANLALIQRDDGALLNGIVTYDALSPTLQTAGLAPLSGWLTGTAYTPPQAILNGSSLYQCLVAHTSGVFATDLAAGKWILLANLSILASTTTAAANTVLAGPTTGAATAPTFRTLVPADISAIDFISLTSNVIYGSTTPNGTLNLAGTSSGSPNGDDINLLATNTFFYIDKVPGNQNYASISYGTGPNGEGAAFSMHYQHLNNTAPTLGQELGFWQVYAWDGTQTAPTGNPPAIVFGATENWTATHHGTAMFVQAIPNGTANAQNEFAVGGGVTALAFGASGETQGMGQGTFNAQNTAGYFINGSQVLSVNGGYTELADPSGRTAISFGNVDEEFYLNGNVLCKSASGGPGGQIIIYSPTSGNVTLTPAAAASGTVTILTGTYNLVGDGISNTFSATQSFSADVGFGTAALSSAFTAIAAGTTAKAQINLAGSTAPTSPNNGDVWFDGTNLKIRVSGVTKTVTIS